VGSRRKGLDGLTDPQRRAARMRGLGHSQVATAARVGLSSNDGARTIRRWEKIPEFQQAVETAREEATDPSVLDVLNELLNDADPKIRLAAAAELNRMKLPPESPETEHGLVVLHPIIRDFREVPR
jgi:hypothetical protein